VKLYMHPGACSLSPHIVCHEIGIAVNLVEVNRQTHRTSAGEDFYSINGNGYVPILQLDDGERIMEGPAIVQYLADLKPQAGLLPQPGTLARRRVQSLLNFIAAELHKPMAMLMMPAYAPVREALAGHVAKRLDWVSATVAGDYLAGPSFTVADAYLFVCLNWTPWSNIDLTRWPVLVAFMAGVGARPAVQAALAAEGLVPHGEGMFYAPLAMIEASGRRVAAR
jgi:glutathione S-transferase